MIAYEVVEINDKYNIETSLLQTLDPDEALACLYHEEIINVLDYVRFRIDEYEF